MLPAKHRMLFIQMPTGTICYEAARKTKSGINSERVIQNEQGRGREG